jgi:hypothetical protein
MCADLYVNAMTAAKHLANKGLQAEIRSAEARKQADLPLIE